MTNRNQVAMTQRLQKEQHPERFCPARGCLWKTAEVGPNGDYVLNADPCRKHPGLNAAPARKAPRTFSFHQDAALDLCIAKFPTCPFGCAKDGSANCDFNVRQGLCQPGRETLTAATRALAEDTFSRIEKSNAAQDAFARR